MLRILSKNAEKTVTSLTQKQMYTLKECLEVQRKNKHSGKIQKVKNFYGNMSFFAIFQKLSWWKIEMFYKKSELGNHVADRITLSVFGVLTTK